MHLSLRVYIGHAGLRDRINWLRNSHTQYRIVYNKQSNMADHLLRKPVLFERPMCGILVLICQETLPYTSNQGSVAKLKQVSLATIYTWRDSLQGNPALYYRPSSNLTAEG